jgi:methylmalonyl-CoA/ethylmalonyl-CoA epimerase
MSVLKNIHHLTFVVADLDAAVSAYRSKLGLEPFQYDELPSRSVITARVKVGDVWIVLVSPQDDDSDVARHLAVNGEGLLLMSFGVDDLDQAIADLATRGTTASERRIGLDDWQIADLDTAADLKVNCHLTQSD